MEAAIMQKILAAVSVLAAFGAGSAAAEPVCGATTHIRFGETRAYFQDVLAACRPTGYCSVVGEVADPTHAAAFRQQLRVARPAPGAPYQVQFAATDPMPADDAAPMALAFAGTGFDLSDHFAATDSANEYRIADQMTADSVVGELKKARTVRWTYQSPAGPAAATFPLNGLTAALDWIDCMGAKS
jgi:hypothetical protein